eukprot:TRINITY_DN865_c0_g1_i4.p1 TRINITY_DN865_c0_g1~~TRINITY_DN865_c0_g1_i4.p1  ORF type:complete len:322 (+),score=131.97 TRINITY_DN865_c0_g1_i4:135-1100(+)
MNRLAQPSVRMALNAAPLNAGLFGEQRQAEFSAAMWGRDTTTYDRTIGNNLTQCALDIVPMLDAEYGVAVGGDVLDIGCGAGALMEAVAQHRVPHTSFTAVDFAEDMVAATRAKHAANTRGAADHIHNPSFRVMDGQALQFADASFDTAFAMFSTLYFPDKMQGLREMCRVVRPGGLGAVAGWTRDVQWIGYSNKAVVKVLGSRMPYSKPEDDDVPNFLAFADEAAFEEMLRDAGWGKAHVRRLEKTFRFDDADAAKQLWQDMAAAYPTLAHLLSVFPADEQADLRAAVAEEFAALIHNDAPDSSCYGSVTGVATVGLLQK